MRKPSETEHVELTASPAQSPARPHCDRNASQRPNGIPVLPARRSEKETQARHKGENAPMK
jgi:hypothetical protein